MTRQDASEGTLLERDLWTEQSLWREEMLTTIYNCTGHELEIPHLVKTQGVYLFDRDGLQNLLAISLPFQRNYLFNISMKE